MARHAGRMPADLPSLLALPGVGPYTARAVLAFAFEERVAPVDTNIGRVLARIGGRPLAAREAQGEADRLVEPPVDPWRWNQAIMELGATVCAKRAPRCGACPISARCAWQGAGADPAAGSFGTGAPQPRFEGSDRQLRGRLVDAVREGPVGVRELPAVVACDDPGRIERTVATLVADGLVERAGDRIRLAR